MVESKKTPAMEEETVALGEITGSRHGYGPRESPRKGVAVPELTEMERKFKEELERDGRYISAPPRPPASWRETFKKGGPLSFTKEEVAEFVAQLKREEEEWRKREEEEEWRKREEEEAQRKREEVEEPRKQDEEGSK